LTSHRHPSSDQRLRLEDTPSRGKIVEESISFSLLKPAIFFIKTCHPKASSENMLSSLEKHNLHRVK
jgi:hypothetical protein